MSKRHLFFVTGVVAALVALAAPATAELERSQVARASVAPIAIEQVGGTFLTIQPSIAFERASLRVSGPDGYALRKTVAAAGPIAVDLLAEARPRPDANQLQSQGSSAELEELADGIYRYEVVFYAKAGGRRVHTGRFFVEAGAALSRAAKRSELGEVRQQLEAARLAKRAGDDGVSGPPQEGIFDSDYIYLDDLANDGETAVVLDSDGYGVPGGYFWGMANEYDALELGRTNLSTTIADPYMTLLYGGEVGIGTTAPTAGLHIDNDGIRQLRINGFGGYESSFGVGFIGTWLYDDDGEAIAQFNHGASYGTLIVDSDGLEVNAEKINLQSSTGATQVIVQENGASGRRQLFRLENNGPPEFSLVDNDRTLTWKFGTRADSFEINRGGSGKTEMILRANGNLDIQGVLSEGSSRAVKRDFETLDSGQILARLDELPLFEWSYKATPREERHFGPMAEDFHAAFGLGRSAERLSALDTSGIALAAVQGLNRTLEERLAEKEDEIAALRDEVAELRRLVEASLR